MAFLDEIALILEGSTAPLYPLSSGDYWVAMETTATGLLFEDASGLLQLTTSAYPTGIVGHGSTDYLLTFDAAAGANTDWPIYLGHLPDSTVIGDKAVALVNTVGGPDMERVDLELRGLQVVVRGESINQTATGYQDAMDRAVEVRDGLAGYTGSTPTGTHYAGITAENGPFFAGFDDSLRPSLSMNLLAWRARV